MSRDRNPFAKACEAVTKARCLELTYDGHERVVEVHVAGYSRDDVALMRVWQVRGGSTSGQPTDWKMFRLDQVSSARLSRERSHAPHDGYEPHDPVIHRIVCQV
jgi:hypothetical protein